MRRVALFGLAGLVLARPTWGHDPPVRAGRCELEGRLRAVPVTLRVPGLAPFVVTTRFAALRTRAPFGAFAKVRVVDALAFEGRAPSSALPLRFARPVSLADGILTVTPDFAIIDLSGGGARGRFRARVRIGHGVHAEVEVPCDVLEVDDAELARVEPAPATEAAWYPWSRWLVLRARPGAGPRVTLRLDSPWALGMYGWERHGDWLHLDALWADGSRLDGWVLRRLVRHPRSGTIGLGGGGGSGSGYGRESGCLLGAPGGYHGPAVIAPGTQVYAAPGQGPWAEVRRFSGWSVTLRPEDRWVRIVRAPGLDLEPCTRSIAWVPRSAVGIAGPDLESRGP